MNLLVLTFLTVLAGSFVVSFAVLTTNPASKSTTQRIGAIQHSARWAEDAGFEMKLRDQRRQRGGLRAILGRLQAVRHLDTLFAQANSRVGLRGWAVAAIALAAISPVVILLFGAPALLAFAAAPAGPGALYAWLRFQRTRRVRHFNAALPDAIDLLARALRAGHSVGSAIEMVGEQSPEPLASEFIQVFQQQRLGLPFRDALTQMSERVPSRDLSYLITALLIQKETGGDLTEILERTAHVIRERIRIAGEVRTRTAQGRLTGWILALLPIVMLVLINLVNPGYSGPLFHDPKGRALLYLGAGLIAAGGLIIRKIVDVRV